METKCTGIIGLIFGHRWERIGFLTFSLGKAGQRMIPVFPVDAPEINESHIDYLIPGDCYCQRCGAVTGA